MVTVRLWAVTGHARAIWAEPSVCTDMPGSLWAVPLPREQPCRLKSLSKQFLVSGDIPNFIAGCSLSGYRRSARCLMGPEMREEVLQQAIQQITELVLLHGGPVTGSTAFVDAGAWVPEYIYDMPFCGHKRRVGLQLFTTVALPACLCCCYWNVGWRKKIR
uniref:Uncharacterized protein n=1 Tax=Oryza barthii TaxID=65489 RepID=A0A0D3FXR4_9ORYZ